MLSGMSPGGLLSTAAGLCDGAAPVVGLGCGFGDAPPVAGAPLVWSVPVGPAAPRELPWLLQAAAPSANKAATATNTRGGNPVERPVDPSMTWTLGAPG